MRQVILVLEGRSNTETDYKYIKSIMDYFYDTRRFSIKRINATCKSKLIDQKNKIDDYIKRYDGETIVILVSDYDKNDKILNDRIVNYCCKNRYELVWMNENIEDVCLGRIIANRNKVKEAVNFLKIKDSIIERLTQLNIEEPINKKHSTNLLFILDKYLDRK